MSAALDAQPQEAIGRRARLRRWLDGHEVERTGRTGPRGALLQVALVYLVGFGMPIVAAVRAVARGGEHHHGGGALGWSTPLVLELGLNAAAVLIAIPLLAREAPTWARPIASGPRWRVELKAFGLGVAAMFAGGVAMRLLGWLPHPADVHPGWSGWPAVVAVSLAGPAEEIVVLVAPLVLLRAARWPWWAVVAAMVVLRLAYHVYYGFPVLGFGVWAVAMIVIYLRAHAVIGLIVAHSFWDAAVMLAARWRVAGSVLISVTLLGLLAWGVVSLCLWLVNRSDRRRAERLVGRVAQQQQPPTPIGWYQNSTGHWWWWDGQRWSGPAPPAHAGDPSR